MCDVWCAVRFSSVKFGDLAEIEFDAVYKFILQLQAIHVTFNGNQDLLKIADISPWSWTHAQTSYILNFIIEQSIICQTEALRYVGL